MNKSDKCTYTIGVNEIAKKKFLHVGDAVSAANFQNQRPTTIHLFAPYKCTKCHFFHIGKTKKLKQEDSIWNNKI